jgi:hypothetical protein
MKHNESRTLPRNAVDLPVRLFILSTIELDLLCLNQWKRLAVEARVQSLTRHVVICGGQSDTGTNVRSFWRHSTTASYSFAYSSLTLLAAILATDVVK